MVERNETLRQVMVLLAANFDAEQVARIKAVHPALIVYGEPGGIALEPPIGLDAMELTYPQVRPDLDVDAILRQVEVIVASRLPKDIRQRAPCLKWVQYLGAGIDHLLPPDELRQCDFIITNVSGIHAIPLAETVLTMMLNLAKSWRVFEDQQRRHVWHHHIQTELNDKTLGIVALGRVGREVARLGSAMRMQVVAYDPYVAAVDAVGHVDKFFSRREQLPTILAMSDFVVCCAPFTKEIYHMLGEAEFRAMKSSAYFINVGRGQISGEAVVIRALQEGWIAGAGLDAFEGEPLPADSPLWDMPNVILLPHQSPNTDRYMERATEIVCENLLRYAEGRPLIRVADPARGF